jgi:hypothetical protein
MSGPKSLEKSLEHTALPKGMVAEEIETGKHMHLPKGGVVKETIVESLGDGTRCETDVVRDSKGKIVSETTNSIGPDGTKKHVSKAVCAGTHVHRRLQSMQPPPFAQPVPYGGGLGGAPLGLGSPPLAPMGISPPLGLGGLGPLGGLSLPGLALPDMIMSDLWVIGDVFFRKYAVILDFENLRLGVALPRAGGGSDQGLTPQASFGGGGGITSGMDSGGIESFVPGGGRRLPQVVSQKDDGLHLPAAAPVAGLTVVSGAALLIAAVVLLAVRLRALGAGLRGSSARGRCAGGDNSLVDADGAMLSAEAGEAAVA